MNYSSKREQRLAYRRLSLVRTLGLACRDLLLWRKSGYALECRPPAVLKDRSLDRDIRGWLRCNLSPPRRLQLEQDRSMWAWKHLYTWYLVHTAPRCSQHRRALDQYRNGECHYQRNALVPELRYPAPTARLS